MDFADAYLLTKLGHPELAGWWGKVLGGGAKTFYDISPKQTGTGDPSPDNIRPILPGLTLIRDDDTVLEVYGGTLDVPTGVLTVTWASRDLGEINWLRNTNYTNPLFYRVIAGWKVGNNNGILPIYTPTTNSFNTIPNYHWKTTAINSILNIRDDRYATAEEFKAAMNGVLFVYELKTPITYHLTQAEVQRAVAALKR